MKQIGLVMMLLCMMVAGAAFAGGESYGGKGSTGATSSSKSSAVARVGDVTAQSFGGGGGDGNTYALGLGSGSPSANACQKVVFFGFNADVPTCMLQQWAMILGDAPSPIKLQIACQDAMLVELPMCDPYRKVTAQP